ncbi:peptidoglycan/LPS O-acetylase OafA/YrhL [Microbacteriaceae bacterium SG_E_30_P1]|uniref:Peptidoglycan/LPS O-acetylase OafA/YrhL n=1 Tax=Antiquaquibacter oligotrophicus TaxID=2880260 RepID=A0ABT6KPB9_9MICO|nr:VanZ family protein [Antiquaquibacter oligotrophicus]MDH6181313.1 peptidoglycan/LPS O-acetylase OafA/YrhL [Antiquaquibacter oligotrophicus]UDF12994.1 VanZ family protein [Antiquaquibacter oligotrophicus]
MIRRRHLLVLVAFLYIGMLVGLTFVPGATSGRQWWWLPVVLFMPVGFLLTLMMGRRRWWVAIGFGVLGAAWVEAAQTIWMPDGSASVLDIVLSSIGAVLGVVIGVIVISARLESIRSHAVPSIVPQAGSRGIPQD